MWLTFAVYGGGEGPQRVCAVVGMQGQPFSVNNGEWWGVRRNERVRTRLPRTTRHEVPRRSPNREVTAVEKRRPTARVVFMCSKTRYHEPRTFSMLVTAGDSAARMV